MPIGLELLLASGMALLLVGGAVGVTLALFVGYPWVVRRARREQFPNVIPGTSMRCNDIPVLSISLDDVARAWRIFQKACLESGYSRRDLDKEFSEEYIEFVRGVEGKRYIVDRYGRKIAGDRAHDVCRVVVIEGDTLEKTACFHEWGHGAHAAVGMVDYDHQDPEMWEKIVPACKEIFARRLGNEILLGWPRD